MSNEPQASGDGQSLSGSAAGSSSAGLDPSSTASNAPEDRLKAIQEILDSAKQAEETIRTLVTSIEASSRMALSESAATSNARKTAESQASEISVFKGTAEATVATLNSVKQNIDTSAQKTKEILDSVLAASSSIAKQNERALTLSASIEAAEAKVKAVLPSIEKGSSDANAISVAKGAADANALAIGLLQSQMKDLTAKAKVDGDSLAKTEKDAKDLLDSIKVSVETVGSAQRRVSDYEAKLAEFQELFRQTHEKLETLLPHATSAGLASAFQIQRARFDRPRKIWLTVFVAALVTLSVSAYVAGLPPADSWEGVLRHLIARLPFAVPLIWLGIYAGHQYGLAKRVEEDYAYKEAVSTAFEGYKREMEKIARSDSEAAAPLVALCANVLQTFGERPGRLYDKHVENPTPLSPLIRIFDRFFPAKKEDSSVPANESVKAKPE